MPDVESVHARDTTEHQLAPGSSMEPSSMEPAEHNADLDAGTGDLVVRLLVGALVEGSDEALRRLRQWNEEAQLRAETHATLADDHHLRWMLLGLLFELQAGVQHQLALLRQRGARALYHPMVTLHSMEEGMREWLPSRFVRRIDAWRADERSRRERWIREGYLAEQEGRQLARHATQAAMEELLDYFSRNPQVRELIEQQSVGVADEAVGEVRARAASADTRLEQITHAILRRTPPSRPLAASGQAANPSQPSPASDHAEKAK